MPEPKKKRLPILKVIQSVLAAAFGVQKEENRQRDLKQGNLLSFIIASVLLTIIFIGILALGVSLVLP